MVFPLIPMVYIYSSIYIYIYLSIPRLFRINISETGRMLLHPTSIYTFGGAPKYISWFTKIMKPFYKLEMVYKTYETLL